MRQQKELADSIIAKVSKELENPKVLQQILNQAVSDVESKYLTRFLRVHILISYRNCANKAFCIDLSEIRGVECT